MSSETSQITSEDHIYVASALNNRLCKLYDNHGVTECACPPHYGLIQLGVFFLVYCVLFPCCCLIG